MDGGEPSSEELRSALELTAAHYTAVESIISSADVPFALLASFTRLCSLSMRVEHPDILASLALLLSQLTVLSLSTPATSEELAKSCPS
jgi:hypothetical protein